MKKTIILTVLFIVLLSLPSILFVYLKNISEPLVLGIQKEDQLHYFFDENQSLTFSEENKDAKNKNNTKIEWTASFKYPYLSEEPIHITITERDLTWEWIKTENQITGESFIESSPITLKYYIENEIITGEITIENKTNEALESLQYVLKIEHPPSYKPKNKELIQSKENHKQSLKITSEKNPGELLPNFQGKEKSSSDYILTVGDVKPGESNTQIFHFSYEK